MLTPLPLCPIRAPARWRSLHSAASAPFGYSILGLRGMVPPYPSGDKSFPPPNQPDRSYRYDRIAAIRLQNTIPVRLSREKAAPGLRQEIRQELNPQQLGGGHGLGLFQCPSTVLAGFSSSRNTGSLLSKRLEVLRYRPKLSLSRMDHRTGDSSWPSTVVPKFVSSISAGTSKAWLYLHSTMKFVISCPPEYISTKQLCDVGFLNTYRLHMVPASSVHGTTAKDGSRSSLFIRKKPQTPATASAANTTHAATRLRVPKFLIFGSGEHMRTKVSMIHGPQADRQLDTCTLGPMD